MGQQRLVPVEGALNFRDLGGYPTGDGRRVRWKRLYRADSLHRLTGEDLTVVGKLGLRTVIDLRAGNEVDLNPDRLPEDKGIQRHHLPMLDPAMEVGDSVLDRVKRGDFEGLGAGLITPFYLEMLERYALAFGEIVTHAATAERLPLLFHCAGGKDRTGLAAALTLSVLGVPDEHVVADYAITEERLRSRTEQWRPSLRDQGIPDLVIDELLSAQPGSMASTLNALRDRYVTVEQYLSGPGGADPGAFETLRELVLERPDP